MLHEGCLVRARSRVHAQRERKSRRAELGGNLLLPLALEGARTVEDRRLGELVPLLMDRPDLQRAAILVRFLHLVHGTAGSIAAIVPEAAALAGRPIGIVSMFRAPRVLLAGPGRAVLGEQGAHGSRADGLADHRQPL